MIRSSLLALLLLAALSAPAAAQGDWRPPGRAMPEMPSSAELAGDWLSSRASWFRGVQATTGVAPSALVASGEPRGAEVCRVVRFQSGPLPVVVWTDRDGDGKADSVELYRDGGVVAQLLDSNHDGSANVLRRYDSSGALISEERMDRGGR